jgi:hypothetical protein
MKFKIFSNKKISGFVASAQGCPTQNFDQCSNNCERNVGGGAEPEATVPFGRHASHVPDGCGGCKRNYPLPECYTNDSGMLLTAWRQLRTST